MPQKTVTFLNGFILKASSTHNKSVVQVVLRWMQQQQIIMIPKTWNINHLQENISIFDFELSIEEMQEIDSLDKGKFLNYNPYSAQEGLPKKYKKWPGFEEWNNYYQPHGIRKIISKIIK